jgi:hypothetical protein
MTLCSSTLKSKDIGMVKQINRVGMKIALMQIPTKKDNAQKLLTTTDNLL